MGETPWELRGRYVCGLSMLCGWYGRLQKVTLSAPILKR